MWVNLHDLDLQDDALRKERQAFAGRDANLHFFPKLHLPYTRMHGCRACAAGIVVVVVGEGAERAAVVDFVVRGIDEQQKTEIFCRFFRKRK